MLNLHARDHVARAFQPLANAFARTGLTPNAITVIGTAGVAGGAFGFYPRGSLFGGTLVITGFVLFDILDGMVARIRGTGSKFGAFLDSCLDRIADGSVFGALVIWFARGGHNLLFASLAVYCLVAGVVVSYAKARAESLGFHANVGLMERSERLLVILVATGLTGLGVPYIEAIALWSLAVLTTFTVFQRFVVVYRQAIP